MEVTLEDITEEEEFDSDTVYGKEHISAVQPLIPVLKHTSDTRGIIPHYVWNKPLWVMQL